ncbi:disulfide bond formation protein B [Verticiella sediminum]|uniref:Disulfide bond formation protein B n=1 Tax=Verticiella sediminum TaxID=1247510 RepID=A0A556AY68_9BURK|nr:disulfide bond formation protein B [Verticiella sediminum]TSH97867.1 disulfide bond formation protein B [Verticiella sediminum]
MPSVTYSRALGATALLAFLAFGFALFSQHVLGMQPCAWCVLQRIICLAIGIVAALGWFARRRGGIAPLASAVVFLLAIGGAVAAWYQHTVAAHAFTCDLSFADRVVVGSGLDAAFPQVFGIWATCADSATTLLGVSYDIWTLIFFIALAALNLLALGGRRANRAG